MFGVKKKKKPEKKMLETAIEFLRSHRGRQIRLVMDKKEVKITKFGDIFVRCRTFVGHS